MNERRFRTAMFSVNGTQQKLTEQTATHFSEETSILQEKIRKSFFEKFEQLGSQKNGSENQQIRNLKWTLSGFQKNKTGDYAICVIQGLMLQYKSNISDLERRI